IPPGISDRNRIVGSSDISSIIRPLYSTDLAFVHDAAFGEFNRRVAPEIVKILRGAGIRAGRVVDAGCGSGILAQRLIAAGYDVAASDVSPAMIRLAR